MALLLTACAIEPGPDPGQGAARVAQSTSADEASSEPQAIPDGAIEVDTDYYMLPMGSDEDGCPWFQPWSPTLMVVQALHWRTAEGEFTLDRAKAQCPQPREPGATTPPPRPAR